MKIIVDFAAIVGALVTLMYLVTSGAAVPNDPCIKSCPYIYDPICAYTGNTWQTLPSKCAADIHACDYGKKEYKPYYYGECENTK